MASENLLYSVDYSELCKHNYILPESCSPLQQIFLQHFQCYRLNYSEAQIASGFVFFEHKLFIFIYIDISYYETVYSFPFEAGILPHIKPLELQDLTVMILDASQFGYKMKG